MHKLKNGERYIHIEAGWDKRDPNPSKNYGVSGGRMTFFERRGSKIIQCNFLLDNYPTEELRLTNRDRKYDTYPICDGLGTHYKFKKDASEWAYKNEECLVTGGKCYFEAGSALYGEIVRERFLKEGSDGVWDEIDKEFREQESNTEKEK